MQFEYVEWSITLLHRPTFERVYESFWFLDEDVRAKVLSPLTPPESALSSGTGYGVAFLAASAGVPFQSNYYTRRTNGMGSGSRTTEAENEVNPPWIALLFAVLCVSLERMGWSHAHKIGIVKDIDEFKNRARLLLEGSQAVLALADLGKVRAIEVIQTLVLHLHCQQTISVGGWDVQTALYLAVAARVGTMTGMSKLTAEKIGETPKPGLLKREASTTVIKTLNQLLTDSHQLGRRAWWNLIERDWTLSLRMGNTYVVNPHQNFSELPANLEWEDLENGRRDFLPRGWESWTVQWLLL